MTIWNYVIVIVLSEFQAARTCASYWFDNLPGYAQALLLSIEGKRIKEPRSPVMLDERSDALYTSRCFSKLWPALKNWCVRIVHAGQNIINLQL